MLKLNAVDAVVSDSIAKGRCVSQAEKVVALTFPKAIIKAPKRQSDVEQSFQSNNFTTAINDTCEEENQKPRRR